MVCSELVYYINGIKSFVPPNLMDAENIRRHAVCYYCIGVQFDDLVVEVWQRINSFLHSLVLRVSSLFCIIY